MLRSPAEEKDSEGRAVTFAFARRGLGLRGALGPLPGRASSLPSHPPGTMRLLGCSKADRGWRRPGDRYRFLGSVIGLAILFLTLPYYNGVVFCATMARKVKHGFGTRGLYYRTAEVASILGISTRTLFRKLKSGEFPEPKRDPVNNYRVWTIIEIELLGMLMKG